MEQARFKMAVIIGLFVAIITLSTVEGCEDAIDNCQDYDQSACTQYEVWAKRNCAKTCKYCGSPTPRPETRYCEYNGKQHADGSNWLEGCKARCQCKLSKGKFPIICNALCWDYEIPSRCHWVKPTPGKCCHTPWCPSGVKVTYPDGYSYWGEDVDMKIIPW